MIKKIDLTDIDNLAKGATFLGSGGGGDPNYEIDFAKNQILKYGAANLIAVEQLNDEDLILPIAFVGAPLVAKEKLPSGIELPSILSAFKKYYGKLPASILPGEIGGLNALIPLMIAARTGLSIVDGDLLGRAYPELQMASPNLFGLSLGPGFISDALGNIITIEAKSAKDLERIARSVSVACGSSIAMGMYPMTGKQAKLAVVRGTVSQAISLGKIMSNSKDAINDLLKATDGKLIASGIITDIEQQITAGFLKGTVHIKASDRIFRIDYQNEYLAIYDDMGDLVCCTPDIIAILDQTIMAAITSESLIFGLRVHLLSMKAADIWYSDKGLALVGPKAFNIREKIK